MFLFLIYILNFQPNFRTIQETNHFSTIVADAISFRRSLKISVGYLLYLCCAC